MPRGARKGVRWTHPPGSRAGEMSGIGPRGGQKEGPPRRVTTNRTSKAGGQLADFSEHLWQISVSGDTAAQAPPGRGPHGHWSSPASRSRAAGSIRTAWPRPSMGAPSPPGHGALVEAPTGTGKSSVLLAAALEWTRGGPDHAPGP